MSTTICSSTETRIATRGDNMLSTRLQELDSVVVLDCLMNDDTMSTHRILSAWLVPRNKMMRYEVGSAEARCHAD